MLNDLYKKITGKMSAIDRHKKTISKTFNDVDSILDMDGTSKPVKKNRRK